MTLRIALLLFIAAIPGSAQIFGRAYQDGTTLPDTCSVGQVFFKTNAVAGRNLYACTAANVWSEMAPSPFYDVRKYGSVASVGVDNTAAFQAAIDAIPAGQGGIVFIPKGDYGIGTININKNGVKLVGEGGSGSVRLYARFQSTPGPGIKITGQGVTVVQLAVNGQDGSSAAPAVMPTAGLAVDGTGIPGGVSKVNMIDVGSEGHFALGALQLKNAVDSNFYACGFQVTSGSVLYLNSGPGELDNENNFFGPEFHQMSTTSTWPVVHVTGAGGHNTLRMYAPLLSANTNAPPFFKFDASTSDYLFSGMKFYSDTGGINPSAAFELAAGTTHQNLMLDSILMEPTTPAFTGTGTTPGLQVRNWRGGTTALAPLMIKSKAAGVGDVIDCRAAGDTSGDGCKIVLTRSDGTIEASMFTTAGGTLRFKTLQDMELHTGDVAVSGTGGRIHMSTTGIITLRGITKWANNAEPACNESTRGYVVRVEGAGGVADTFRICGKNASDAYAYQPLATFP